MPEISEEELNRIKPESRRGRKPGAGKFSPKQIKEELDGLIRLINGFVGYTPYGVYQLQEDEIEGLRDALAMEVEANPKVLEWASRIGRISPHIILAQVVLVIVLRRLPQANRGEVGSSIRASDTVSENGQSPFPVGTGGASGNSGGYGNGENVSGFNIVRDTAVHSESEIEG